jgi:Ca2+/H+ antiporter, TMEM165/GDT1 family
MTWGTTGLVVSTFLASAVEFVEAFTIVLAMGLTRGWRSALAGTAAAIAVLAAITAGAGYALVTWFPESLLQLIVGTLLLIFGLQWLRKAILRGAGVKALHDEEQAFQREYDAARRARQDSRFGLDWFGFVVSFKGVLLEGLEIVFIVITFGTYWAIEGLGVFGPSGESIDWPGGDLALPALLILWIATSWLTIRAVRQRQEA